MLLPLLFVVVGIGVALLAVLLDFRSGLTAKKCFAFFYGLGIYLLILWYVPYFTFGYGWGIVGTGDGGWSMAGDNGIMPGSMTLHKARPEYSVGDDISFWYKGRTPEETGRSVKRIVAVNLDGTYQVEGLNKQNTVPLHDTQEEDIQGEIVWHMSYMPVFYWRMISCDFTLPQLQIEKKRKSLYTLSGWRSIDEHPYTMEGAKEDLELKVLSVSTSGINKIVLIGSSDSDPRLIADGDEETFWTSSPFKPTSLEIYFDGPVGSVEIISDGERTVEYLDQGEWSKVPLPQFAAIRIRTVSDGDLFLPLDLYEVKGVPVSVII